MPPKTFFWVNKNSRSAKLSQSSADEESDVRRHAQCNRPRKPAPSTAYRWVDEKNPSQQSVTPQTPQDLTPTGPSLQNGLPRSFVPSGLTLSREERRSLDFFILRTAREWSGWDDAFFWNCEVLQAGQTSIAVAHGLVAISATHESFGPSSDSVAQAALRHFALTQLKKAISCLTTKEVSYLESLMTCIILICLQNVQNGRQTHQLLRSGELMLKELNDKLVVGCVRITTSETRILEKSIKPLFDRFRARLCMIGDPVAALAVSVQDRRYTESSPPVVVPDSFETLKHGQTCLKNILGWGRDIIPRARTSEIARCEAIQQLRQDCSRWETAIQRDLTEESAMEDGLLHRSRRLMHIGCLFGRILLETMDAARETIYDQYVAEFALIVDMIEENSRTSHRSTNMSFGIDSGLVDIAAFVGERCRDPRIRRSAMAYLASGKRVEGDRATLIAARILQAHCALEENDLVVNSCEDIPEHRRWRILQGGQYLSTRQLRLDFIRSPYDPLSVEDILSVWIPLPRIPPLYSSPPGGSNDLSIPDMILGRGYVAFLDAGPEQEYYQVHSKAFYFPIPRV